MNAPPLTPHVVAPVSSVEMCRAAVHNGAREIYVGVPGFNARPRAHDLDLKTLREIADYAHLHGVKVSFAFNVLIFEDEMERALGLLADLAALGPDAFIVQDIGLARLIHAALPTVPIHASTQMTVSSSLAIEALSTLSFSRFILARELSLNELKEIRTKTSGELEIFVHGALCLSFSGQCLSSLFQGGRSANRGECAQPCRLPYELWLDGKRHGGHFAYPLSLADLSSPDIIPDLLSTGVSHFKIEGRLKEPEYVAATVRTYSRSGFKNEFLKPLLAAPRMARSEADVIAEASGATRSPRPSSRGRSLERFKNGQEPIFETSSRINPAKDHSLAITFSRRSEGGWLSARGYLDVSCADYPGHRGLPIGTIKRISRNALVIETDYPLRAGDGLLFLGGPEPAGARVYELERNGKTLTLKFANNFKLETLREGFSVYVNSSPAVQRRLRESYTSRDKFTRIPIRASVSGAPGEHLLLRYEDEEERSGSAETAEPLAAAKTAALSEENLRAELGALSATPYALQSLENNLKGDVFIQSRDLRRLRQQAVEELNRNRAARPPLETGDTKQVLQPLRHALSNPPGTHKALRVLVRKVEQIAAAAAAGIEEIYIEVDRQEKLEEARAEALRLKRKIGLVTPRILKEGETEDFLKLCAEDWDFYLMRNLGALQILKRRNVELVADSSLNAANHLSLDWLLSIGFQTISPALDLDENRLRRMVERSHSEHMEIPVYFHVPAFHTQFCLYSATCRNGLPYPECGSPCLRSTLFARPTAFSCEKVTSAKRAEYRVLTDSLCRNTLFFNSPEDRRRPLLPALTESGARFRIELLDETAEETRRVIEETLKLGKFTSSPQRP